MPVLKIKQNGEWVDIAGGGGYTKTTKNVTVKENTNYSITIGAGGSGIVVIRNKRG